jgi:hypothetical protein
LNGGEWESKMKVELRFEFVVLGRGIACMIPKSFCFGVGTWSGVFEYRSC